MVPTVVGLIVGASSAAHVSDSNSGTGSRRYSGAINDSTSGIMSIGQLSAATVNDRGGGGGGGGDGGAGTFTIIASNLWRRADGKRWLLAAIGFVADWFRGRL